MSAVEQMKKFMEPKSVAIFGVSSRRTGEGAFNILENLLHYGYQGRIYPVNPNATEIMGLKTYSSAKDIGEEVDLAVINLPRNLVPGIVRECAEVGIKSIVIATQGFADANDEEGKRLQEEIDEYVKSGKVRIMGPNSLGTANPYINFSSSFIKVDMHKLPIGTICQSGIFFGFSHVHLLGKGADLANCCDIDFADSLEYFEQDPETKVIALHIEGMQDSKRFLKVVSRITPKKPVLALKTGRSEQAAQAAQSHTGSLVGRDEVWEAALKQAGVIRVNSPDELGELAVALSLLPPMKGRRVGVVTGSGGFGVMTVDTCAQFNLEVDGLSPTTIERIKPLFPSWQSLGNPLDVLPAYLVSKQPYHKVLTECLDAVLSDSKIDAVLLMGGVAARSASHHFSQAINELAEAHPDKPFVCFIIGDYAGEAKNILESARRVMVFQSPYSAVRVLAHLAQYSAFRSRL